ncbi:Hypothetical predicted protein [Mytilus galloprovincialis]|uniref:Novel STAND NTPase 3 domain-containing protein n=1 Tax=Mytilus galloprovincialis TaxID=29158 RepID=A0A8B6FGW5_MYTGA|nr:Hypothetical predicted protein [Mytilus galloprovincialis]
MALSTLAREQENFLRYAILIVDHTKEALQDLIELNLKNKHLTFEEFLNKNKHEIYHLCYDYRCCQCLKPLTKRKRIIFPSQLELLFDKYNKLPSHKRTGHNDFCCSYAKVGITSQVLDLSLARCLLVNCCLDVFWYMCLNAQGQTLEQFLNSKKHVIYHLWKNNQKCCQCPPGFIFPRDISIITENEWRDMFNSVLLPCFDDRKRTSTETTSVCSVAARPGIDVKDLHPEIQGLILKWCCSVRDSVEKLVTFRHLNFGHVENAKLSHANFKKISKETEECILHIASFCKKDQIVKDALNNLHSRPIDATLCSHYQNILLENINRNEAISENIEFQHSNTRRLLPRLVDKSCKVRKIEKRIDALETSNAKIKEDIQDIHKLVKEGPKRQRLIDQTSAEIDSHKKEGTYLETEAVRQCIQLLECRNVVILSGREGSGKSRNGLEILRQLKERHTDSDVFKLIGLNYISDIVKCNVTSIVLFDDAFDKTSKHFSYDEQVLNHFDSYIRKYKVKIIFTMRNYVRHACHRLLSTHKLFREFVDIDLNSENLKLTMEEKEEMFTNYCTINKIRISEKKKDATDQSVVHEAERNDNETTQSVPDQSVAILKREMMNEIIETDPFLGFPECCRLFTENRNNTFLRVACFKWPSVALVNDIEKTRMEGINNYINGLKYVILVVILTKGYSILENKYIYRTNCTLVESNLDEVDCKQIFKICYSMDVEVRKSDIENVCKELTERYLVNLDGTYFFQHKAIQDSVLISYSRINTEAIIPLLSFDHLVDIVGSQNYTEQEDEIVIKISKPYYPKLASKIILSGLCSNNKIYPDRFTESTLIKENDTDLVYQLILGIEKEFNKVHICDFIPLLLLRNIGKLDDKMLTVNHIAYKMSVSFTIRDKNITLSIVPESSLIKAYRLKYTDICIWLLKRTDHSKLNYYRIFDGLCTNEALKCIQMLLENVEHRMINMTQLLKNLCIFEHDSAVDWLLHSVDNSLIDYTELFDNFINACDGYSRYCNINKVINILKNVNHRWLNINNVVKQCCELGGYDIVEWVLKNCDHTLLDYEGLLKIAIGRNEELVEHFHSYTAEYCRGCGIILELLISHKPGIICCNINKLLDVAIKFRMDGVLKLLFKHDINKSLHIDKIIEHIFKLKDDEEQYDMRDYYMYSDDEYCQKIIQLIVKYYSNYVNVNELIEKACQFGIDDIVELFLEKLDNISYYLDITLLNLRNQQLNDDDICSDTGYGKIIMLLLPRMNYKFIDFNSVMNDICHIGHSSAVLWLIENKPAYPFNMKNVMNKACFNGDLQLVECLYKKYNKKNFDYKTSMIKACRNRNRQWETLDVCKWLWGNIDRDLFNMKVALNNASRCDNYDVVEWILTEVDKGLLDIEAAVLCASEHGEDHTVKLLLDKSSTNMIDLEHAITLACKNEKNGFKITKLLYERADKSTVDLNVVFSVACKNYRSDIVQWMIETCDQNIIATETDGHKKFISSFDNHLLDISLAINCIVDIDPPKHKIENVEATKNNLLCIILKKFHLKTIDLNKLLTESCKKNWLEIFICLLGKVDHSFLNIREAISIACQHGALNIVKWSLQNIDVKLFDIESVMVESCAYGWLECLVLIQKKCFKYAFSLQQPMIEACTYGRIEIVQWLLQNFNYDCFHLSLLLQEAGRNGWKNMFFSLVNTFQFHTPDLHAATNEALANGHLQIVEWMVSVLGRECIEITSVADKIYLESGNEAVVKFIFQHFDPRVLDIASVFANACKFGWKDTASFIVENDLSSLCDLALAFNKACDNGETEMVKLLLEKVDHQILNVNEAMLSLAVKGWDEIAILLLDKIEHTRLDIRNALIEACRHGEVDVVQAILQKVEHNMLDIEAALDKACENHMHEGLVLWVLDNIDKEQVDLKTVKIQAFRHKWWKVQFALTKVDTEDQNQAEQDTETDNIVFLE